ncbi:Ig-like domain-containing protein [Roseisolibacter agri]|uniref:Big-1 domain-containing protein n=1 Tax=Roseisolibacter agri TaxID=2014610 RepID=A0AA37V1J6_9BACT|nr:Ig-like domain-containing protein [Roseisolibacter agri]GLC23892.1 hypothetical protein rosag_04050 [Roseisolibacter agri]
MRRLLLRATLLAALPTLLGGCAADGTTATTLDARPTALGVVRGGDQSATVGSALPTALTVRVTTAQSTPVAGATVTFAVTAGSATLSPASATTDADGLASTQLTLGATPGTVQVTASVASVGLTATFLATATAAVTTPSASVACAADAAALMAVGQVTVLASVTSLCLPGGAAGAEYALVPFNGSTNAASRASLSVQASGVTAPGAVTAADLTAPLSDEGGLAALTTTGAVASRALVARTPLAALEARQRAVAARELAPRLGAARSWFATRSSARTGLSRAVIPRTAAVGDLVSLNANADDACTNARMRVARVAAIGSKSVVVADTGNPAGGYTDADYASIAATFDTLIAPVASESFGDPTDIDGNGKVVLFFTRAVNELTPASSGWYVGGFFWSRDLFPTTAATAGDACAASNAGELFYLMVPDPSGTINDNRFSKAGVSSVVIGTVAHEYQHLINASRRMYVNTSAADWEDTWLDEGLSHVAEELVFYRAAGLAARANLGAAALRRSSVSVDAFNEFQLENFGRFGDYLAATAVNSPYASDDSLATRGAAWAFLRYAADQKGGTESATWRALVNSTASGMANVRQVFGTESVALFRDWATSLFADDLTGVAARWQQPSWGYRSIFGALGGSGFPLATTTLTDGATRSVTLVGGGVAFLRVGVAANGAGSVAWGTLPTNVQMTVVRTR